MATSTAAEAWAEHNVGHFRRLLYAIVALFLATEITAFSDKVPHLAPASFTLITANVLFAIGFGCPLLLHLSSLPRAREVALLAALGLLFAAGIGLLHHALGVPEQLNPKEVVAAEVITGLGLASLVILSVRAWRNT